MKRYLVPLALAVALIVVAGTAMAYWSGDSVAGGGGAAAATSVNQGATPTASASQSAVTVSWAATTLANGQAVNGYLVKRYDATTLVAQTVSSACTGTIATTSCVESGVPNGSWKYAVTPVFATSWQGPESAKSATVVVNSDATAPTNSITLSSVTGGAFLSGSTVHYRGTAAGSLYLTNAVADSGSGPASSTTAALTGTTTGWTHTPSAVSTPAGGPYVSNPFSWTAGTTSGPGEAVTGRDVAGNTAVTNLTFANDSTAPSAGTISYPDGFAPNRSATVSFTSGTDVGSGIATRRLQRATATLTSTTCGTFGAFTDIGTDTPTSPYTDGSLWSACFKYRYVVTDRVGNQDIATSANVVKIGYAGAVAATAGLLSHWRLGDSATATPVSSDTFTGTNGTLLTAHTGEVDATWLNPSGNSNMVIGTQNRVYRNASGYALVHTTATPASPDYSVEADLYYRGSFADLAGGVIGRFNTSNTSFYMARWENDETWNIVKWSNGSPAWLATTATQPNLTVGQTYRVRLEMSGTSTTTLKLYVNGVLLLTAADSSAPFTAAGKAGIMSGESGDPAQNDATGIQFDNFQVIPPTRATDSKGTNHGSYFNGVTLGAAGALAGDADTAAQFDGVNDYVQMTGTTGIPVGATSRSVEAWFKTSSSARQVIFDYGSLANTQQFGLWIDAGGTTMTAWGFGTGNDKVFTMPAAVNNGSWHQVVQTYNGTSLTIYIDGVALASQAATRSTVMNSYGFAIGAVVMPGDSNSGGYFNGTIDEVSFYTTVLSQATVTDHYQVAAAPGADVAGPTGGSIDATGLVGTGSRYAASTTLSLALDKGTDPSGLATTGNQVRRATATLTNGTCGSFGSYTLVTGGTDPASPLADTVADQACYSYQYVVLDTLGNATTYTSQSIKVDLTAPAAPTLAFSAFTNAFWSGSGTTVYYRSAAASGSFTATGTASDAASGVASYAFPALGANWTSTPGALGVNTYSWSGVPAAPGTKNVTATNNATGVSANSPVTLTADDTAPTGGTVSYSGGVITGTTVSVSFTAGTDAGSGIGTRLLQRASATLTGGTCGSFGSFATVTNGTNPTSPLVDTVTGGSCYKYQYDVADNLGNLSTATSANVVRAALSYDGVVHATTGLLGHWRLGEAPASTVAVDDKGTNNGTYSGGPTLGVSGGIAGDSNTAAQYDGVNDYTSIARQISTDFSIEFWFKSTQGIGTSSSWRNGAGLVDATAGGLPVSPQDFGVSLRSDGVIVAGVGGTFLGAADKSISTSSGGYNNGAWHHVVFTRAQSSGIITLYVDGAASVSAAGANTAALTGAANINFGRIQSGSNYFQGILDEVAIYTSVLSGGTVTSHYSTGTTAADTTGPTGGSVDASGLVGTGARYSTSTTLSLVLAKGTDPSGVATTGNELLRATASLTGGTCGTFGSYALVSGGTDPASPKTDTVADQACYSYQYVVLDTLGNATTYTSPSIKVDATAPSAPTLAFSAFTNTYWPGSGSTVYYRSAAASGSFTATGTATDAASGIASYAFPGLGTNWTSTPGALGVNTYSWSGAPAAPGTKTVTATNNAGTTSAAAPFTLTADDAGPTGNALSYLNGSTTSLSVSVTLTNGTDAGSGIGTRLLQRASATLTSGTCGSFGAFATVTNGTNPTSPVTDAVTVNTCYQYRYVVSDNLGNQDTVASASVVKVIPTYAATLAAAPGLVNWWRLGEATSSSPADDAKGPDDGTYTNSPTVGMAGAIAGDANTAVQLDGADDYVSVNRMIHDDFSIEFWFKSTQGIGAGTTWQQGAGLVDADAPGVANDFGVSLRSDGRVVAGVGNPDTSIVSTTGGWNNGAWHHVVFTRTKATGALVLYVDGTSLATGTGGTQGLTASVNMSLGRINGGTNYLQGSLDEVAVYNQVLTAATVSAHHTTGTTP